MANGIAIKDVDNKLQSLGGEEVIPISTGANEPEVIEVDTLKEYINEDIDTALEDKQDVINDLDTIRSGAALGATALQSYTESDPTVHEWAKAEQKPPYTASEVGAVPTTRKINNKVLSSDINLTASDVGALPDSTVIPAAQVNSDWNASSGVAQILNKPTIPAAQVNADWEAESGVAQILNKPTIPTVPTALSQFEDDLGTSPTHTHSQYLTSAHEVPSGGNAGQILKKTTGTDYDYAWGNMTETYPSAYCTTAGGTALKVANCSLWTATANTYLHILIGQANTYQGALKLKVNGAPSAAGAPIYINGEISSSTNYTLPAGSYIIFYDGTNFYFNTQGKIPTATSVLASVADIPDVSNYVQKSSTSGLLKNDGTVDTTAYTTNIGTVTSVTVNGTTYNPVSGDVDLGNIGGGSGEMNTINSISVNGTAQTPDASKNVNITVPVTDVTVGGTSVVSSGTAVIPAIPTVPSNLVTGTSSSYTIWVGTQAQYEALSPDYSVTTIYLITES